MHYAFVAIALALFVTYLTAQPQYANVEIADDQGSLSFGSLLDTLLYRSTANTLATPGSLIVTGTTTAGTLVTTTGGLSLKTYAQTSTLTAGWRNKLATARVASTALQPFPATTLGPSPGNYGVTVVTFDTCATGVTGCTHNDAGLWDSNGLWLPGVNGMMSLPSSTGIGNAWYRLEAYMQLGGAGSLPTPSPTGPNPYRMLQFRTTLGSNSHQYGSPSNSNNDVVSNQAALRVDDIIYLPASSGGYPYVQVLYVANAGSCTPIPPQNGDGSNAGSANYLWPAVFTISYIGE